MDLVFADDDQLVAAMDLSHDIVLVRRGYERFTMVGRWNDPKVSQPMYGYRALPQAMVPMSDGVKLAVDKKFDPYLDGTVVDFYDGLEKRGFVFNNPNVVKSCGCGSSFQV